MKRRRLISVAALVVVGAGGAAVGHSVVEAQEPSAGTATITSTPTKRHARPRRQLLRLAERRTGRLGTPVQDAAAAPLEGGRTMLLGGLTEADTSRADVRIVSADGDREVGRLPAAVHDAAAVRLGRAVYLFGGGTNEGTQSDAIVRVDASGAESVVGRLPAPSSDQAAANVQGTAYVVGGYTGSHWLDTIVAWRPGSPAHVVARLPTALRYAAVAAAGGHVVIAGGSLPSGTASRTVLSYSPGSGRVGRIARLPSATTHAAAAGVGGLVYVIGGRGATIGSAIAHVVAVDPRTHRVRMAGRLTAPRSDLAAVSVDRARILLAGGRGRNGTLAGLSELVAASSTRRTSRTPAARSVYAFDGADQLRGAARLARPLVYVPNSESDTVDVIDPQTYRVVDHLSVGGLPQHVVPAWDLRTLYVTNDTGNSLTPIDPITGKPRASVAVEDPYNMYFTPDGRYAIVVAERLQRLDFRYAHTFRLHHSLRVPCAGVDHMDFTADNRFLLASCEFSGQLVVVDVRRERVVRTIDLPHRSGMPQDVKLAPDGRIFYVADMQSGGVWEIGAHSFRVLHLLRTGAGAHGLYPSRDGRFLYVTNRSEGSISVISFRTRRPVAKWRLPGGGSPDMGGVSADGRVLWLSGRYSGEVYAVSTRTGHLLARIPVGAGPHGLCVWPQPGRYSLGHTGVLR
jgi:YVTN family beta-propeller protein